MQYTTIVADPPWPYANNRALGSSKQLRPNSYANKMNSPGAGLRYPLMAIPDICALHIPADDNAHLYLWTTNAFMVEAHAVARAWGFEPKTIITWVKVRKDDNEAVSRKMGYYFRGATEHVVFAVRGSLKLLDRNLPTAYLWPRVGKHSQKPDQFYDLVQRASPGPYLELFARTRRLGWDAWGNQVASSVSLDGDNAQEYTMVFADEQVVGENLVPVDDVPQQSRTYDMWTITARPYREPGNPVVYWKARVGGREYGPHQRVDDLFNAIERNIEAENARAAKYRYGGEKDRGSRKAGANKRSV